MEQIMDLTEEQLKRIGEYVSRNFDELIERSSYGRMRSYEITVIERVTRVEEELKSQRDLMMKQHEMTMFGFQQMEKRFEVIQKSMDDRFESMQKDMDVHFGAMQKNMDDRFESVLENTEHRFISIDKRFDDVNRRFTMLMWAMGIGFTLTTTAISIVTVLAR